MRVFPVLSPKIDDVAEQQFKSTVLSGSVRAGIIWPDVQQLNGKALPQFANSFPKGM